MLFTWLFAGIRWLWRSQQSLPQGRAGKMAAVCLGLCRPSSKPCSPLLRSQTLLRVSRVSTTDHTQMSAEVHCLSV